MANTRNILLDAGIRHSVFVQRFAGSQAKEMIRYLEQSRRSVAKTIAGENLSTISRARYQQLLVQLDREIANIYTAMSDAVKNNMVEFAEYEADFSKRLFDKSTSAEFVVPNRTALLAAALESSLILTDDNLTMDSALKQFSDKKRRQLINTINEGVIAGRTTQEILTDTNTVTRQLYRRQASALVSTIVNHVSTTAREAVVAANDDIVTGVEWVSTLDSRTTPQCQALDGQVFDKNSGPRPPIHFNCRSTVIPVVLPQYSIRNQVASERPAVGPNGAEQVSGRTDYNSWLKRQPASFQDEVLGDARGKLFRQGGLSVESFVDDGYKPLTLEQLRRTEPAAFERAGLDNNNL